MKKLNRNKKIILIISLLSILIVGGILAYFTDTQTVSNKITTGIVDIEVNEYTLNASNEEVAWSDKINVTPGEKINKIVKINAASDSTDCYIRAKITLTCEDTTLNASNEMPAISDIQLNISNDWVLKADGYYYYKNVVSASDTAPVQLFSEFTIPSTLDNKWSEQDFDLDVKVDAIQANNFELNINNEKPWGDIAETDIKSAN